MIIIIGCNKGGSGKSTTAVNLAVGLAKQGNEVCIVDADKQRSSATWYMDRQAEGHKPEVTLIEAKDNITKTVKTMGDKFDYVVVDVAGRNSRELITGTAGADLLIAPHQCSQFDLDTLEELQEQLIQIRDLNPELKAMVYHSMASTNPKVIEKERAEFLEIVGEFDQLKPMKSIGHYRKIYRDAVSVGKSVLETDNESAKAEIIALIEEVQHGC